MRTALAILGGLLNMVSAGPYLIDIIKGKTKPNIVSWATWTLLTVIATAAAFSAHAPRAAFLTLGATIATFAVVILGLKYGIAKFSLFDGVCQAAALLGFILWLIFDSPSLALIFSLIIDITVAAPTIRHAWLKPGEETWQAFSIGLSGSVLTLISLSSYTLADLAFPIWFVTFDALIVALIIFRRRQKGMSLAR